MYRNELDAWRAKECLKEVVFRRNHVEKYRQNSPINTPAVCGESREKLQKN